MRKLSKLALVLLAAACISNAQTKQQVRPKASASAEFQRFRETEEQIAVGDSFKAAHDVTSAGTHYAKAVAIASQLPERYFQVKSNAMKKLAEIRDFEKKPADAEILLKGRVTILEKHAEAVGLDLGLALFDLQTHYLANQQVDPALPVAESAVTFYKRCLDSDDPDLKRACDRRMADVEGMMGSGYFLAGRRAEAEPWFLRVLRRKDEDVRPVTMLTSLYAYHAVLIDRGDTEQAEILAKRVTAFEHKYPEARKEMTP